MTRRAGWADQDGDLPVIEGALVRLVVGHMPANFRSSATIQA